MIYLIFFIFLFVRIASILSVQTFFVPDEYWQTLEVAHNFVYGYGHLTWEWREGIRSSFYPLMFAGVFKFLQILHFDSPVILVIIPRVVQAILSAIGDLFTYLLSKKFHGNTSAKWTAFCIISSWFLFYCSSRTLINSAEMAVTSIGLYFYPWSSKRFKVTSVSYMFLAAASCLLRPTAALTWLPLFIWHLSRLKNMAIIWFLGKTLIILIVSLFILVFSDYTLYGQWIFSPWNFFYWNWTLNIGQFYGQHPWHWYLTQGCPAVLTGYLLPFLSGLRKRQLRSLYVLVFYFIASLSFVPHKEFRFLLPILPVMFLICGNCLNGISRHFESQRVAWCLISFLLFTNVPLAAYVSQWHQRGQMDVMLFLRKQVQSTPNVSVLFLMPCHSTPYYSHLHSNISMRFLTCEPKSEDQVYQYEADNFFGNPSGNIKLFLNGTSSPTHIVMFDNIVTKVMDKLEDFRECFRMFNSHVGSNREVVIFSK